MNARYHQLILNDWVSETDVRINSFGVRTSQAKRVEYNNTELFKLVALIKHKFRKILMELGPSAHQMIYSISLYYWPIGGTNQVCATEFDHDGNGLSESAGC